MFVRLQAQAGSDDEKNPFEITQDYYVMYVLYLVNYCPPEKNLFLRLINYFMVISKAMLLVN